MSSTVPTIEGLSPALGVTTGGTSVTVLGAGFDHYSSVRIDGVAVRTFLASSGRVSFSTPPHTAGVVDIAVTDPAGEARLPRSFTFAPPSAFDFNGTWHGLADGPPDSLVGI